MQSKTLPSAPQKIVDLLNFAELISESIEYSIYFAFILYSFQSSFLPLLAVPIALALTNPVPSLRLVLPTGKLSNNPVG